MTEEQKTAAPSRIVVGTERKPCGCVLTEYSDKAKMLAPCVPCGLHQVGYSLNQAGQLLAQAAEALGAVQLQNQKDEAGPQHLEIAEPVLDIPDDGLIESVTFSGERDGWLVLISSAQFSPVPEGSTIPVIGTGEMTKRVVRVVP